MLSKSSELDQGSPPSARFSELQLRPGTARGDPGTEGWGHPGERCLSRAQEPRAAARRVNALSTVRGAPSNPPPVCTSH